MTHKKCPKCLKYAVKKNGQRRGIQTYKCVDCGYKFQQSRRSDKFKKTILKQYIWQRQTLSDLARKYDLSEKWIQKKLDENKINSVVKLNQDTELILVADTTFFSRSEGLTVFREPNLKKIVWWRQTIGEKRDIMLSCLR